MITGSFFSSETSLASLTASADFTGPLTPACEVEKNSGSIWSKSRSSRMRCTRTDPTMPLQPTIPTLNIAMILKRFQHRLAHFCGAGATRSLGMDVGGAQSVTQNLRHRGFDALGGLLLAQRIAKHHRRGQDGRERIGDALARDVRRGAMDRLVQALAARIERGRGQHPDRAREHRRLV